MNRRQFLTRAAAAALPPAAPFLGASGKLRAGSATANISPPLGCSLAGGMTDRLGTQIHDELHVRAVVLDNGNARIGIAVVPGSSFYNDAADGSRQVRFTFCKKEETLAAAAERLSRLRPS